MTALLATEVLKVRTTRSWWGMLLALACWAALWTLPNAFTTGIEFAPGQSVPGMADDSMARTVYTTGLTAFGYVFTLVLGILAISGEYRHQTITPTFLATPRRARVVLAKWVSTGAYALLYGVVALSTSIAVALVVLSARGEVLNLGADGLPRALGLALLAFVLWGLIGIGVGTLVGNQVVAILVGIGFVFVEFVASLGLSFVSWGPELMRWFPSTATSAMLSPAAQGPDGSPLELLPWWAAVLVLMGYAAVCAGLGAASTLRRDVT